MKIYVSKTAEALGEHAAAATAEALLRSVRANGRARIVLSTGASQWTTFDALLRAEIPWEKVEMFHLDEYVGLPESHPASFRKYLKDRFITKVSLKAAYLVDGTAQGIGWLTEKLREAPIDLGLIGIGENAHIAFNDPPADFACTDAYRIVDLDMACKRQQVREGWFASVEEVPKQAVSMTVHQIMQCRQIISCVPHREKAEAVRNTLYGEISPQIPATMLKCHPDWKLFVDTASFAGVDTARIRPGMADGAFAVDFL